MISVFKAHSKDDTLAQKFAEVYSLLMKKCFTAGNAISADDVIAHCNRAQTLLRGLVGSGCEREPGKVGVSTTFAVVVKGKLHIMFPDTKNTAVMMSYEGGRDIPEQRNLSLPDFGNTCLFSSTEKKGPSPLHFQCDIKANDKFLVIGSATFWEYFQPKWLEKFSKEKIVKELTEFMFEAAGDQAVHTGAQEKFKAEAVVAVCDVEFASIEESLGSS